MSHIKNMGGSGWLRCGGAAAVLGLTLAASLNASADTAKPSAASPDWSGYWRIKGSIGTIDSETAPPYTKGTQDKAPLKPEYQREYDALEVRSLEQGDPNAKDALTDTNTLNCFAGMPRLVAAPFGYVFFIQPNKVWVIMDKAVRQIFTDGRAFPSEDQQWPLMLGRSKGHWEGDTLVVDTINMRSDMWLDPTPMMLSDQAVLHERLRKIDANTIENRITIHDPVKFTRDWSFTRHYVKRPENKDEWPDDPELCGGPNDRNPIINGHVTVQLPEDQPAQH